MATWPMVNGSAEGTTVNASLTRYTTPAGQIAFSATEADGQALSRDSYTWAKLYVRVIANSLTGATTLRSRVNGANGNQSVTIGAGTTGTYTDDVNSDSLVSGGLFNFQVVTGTGTSITFTVIASTLTATSNVPILFTGAATPDDYFPFGSTNYVPIEGRNGFHATESRSQYIFRVASTLSNLRVYVLSNSLAGASTIRTRRNTANGNQSVSIGAGVTGAFEDAVNTDAVAVGDMVNYQIVTGGAANYLGVLTYQVKSSSTGRQQAACQAYDHQVFGPAATRYLTIEGGAQELTTTEANTQSAARTAFNARNLFVRIAANTLDGATTVRTRKNGANGNLSVSIGAGATGAFEDTANTDSFIATDLLNYQVDTTASTVNAIRLTIVGFELQQPAVTAPKGSVVPLARGAGVI